MAWQFVVGDTREYLQVHRSTTPTPMGAATQEISVRLVHEVLQVDSDGSAEIRVSLEGLRVMMDGPIGEMEIDTDGGGDPEDPLGTELSGLVGWAQIVRVDRRGSIEVLEVDTFPEIIPVDPEDFISLYLPTLPDATVETGARWTEDAEHAGSSERPPRTYTLEEIYYSGDTRMARLSWYRDFEGPLDDRFSDPEQHGEVLVDLDRGVLIKDSGHLRAINPSGEVMESATEVTLRGHDSL